MSVTRANAAAYLHSQFANLATEITQPLTDDSATGYGPDIDAALRRMGTVESSLATATVEDANGYAYYALGDYYALRRFARLLATRVDSGALVPEGDRQRVFDNVMAMLEEATATITALGYGLDSSTDALGAAADEWGLIDLNTDWIEPGDSASEYSELNFHWL